MKRTLSLLIMFSILISLVGCNGNKISEDMISIDEHNQLMEALIAEYDKKISDNMPEVIRLPKLENESSLMGELHYNEVRDIYAYIDIVGFEVIGNVFLYNPNTGDATKMTSYEYGGKDPTVKKIAWLSENELLMIVGYATGTVTVGGSVYVLNIDTGMSQEIIVPNDMEEIVDMVKPDGGSGKLIFVVAKWNDNFMEFETFNVEYNYFDLRRMIDTDEVVTITNDSYKQKEIPTLSNSINGDVSGRLVKETDQDLLIIVHNYSNSMDLILQVDKESYIVKKTLKIGVIKTIGNPLKVTDDGFLVKTDEEIKLFNNNLELVKSFGLPDAIKEAISMSSHEKLFGGYDVSEDLSKFVFCDHEGMKIIDGKIKTIVAPLNIKSPDGSLGGYPIMPIFLGNQNNVMAMISGYEGFVGFYYYDRIKDQLQEHMGGCDRVFTLYYYGAKLINISPFYSDGYGDGYLMNVDDGSLLQMDRQDIDNDGNLINDDLYYDMDDQILSINQKNSISQLNLRSSQLEMIHRVNLKSENEYGMFSIIGATKEGKVLLLEKGKVQRVYELTWDGTVPD